MSTPSENQEVSEGIIGLVGFVCFVATVAYWNDLQKGWLVLAAWIWAFHSGHIELWLKGKRG